MFFLITVAMVIMVRAGKTSKHFLALTTVLITVVHGSPDIARVLHIAAVNRLRG